MTPPPGILSHSSESNGAQIPTIPSQVLQYAVADTLHGTKANRMTSHALSVAGCVRRVSCVDAERSRTVQSAFARWTSWCYIYVNIVQLYSCFPTGWMCPKQSQMQKSHEIICLPLHILICLHGITYGARRTSEASRGSPSTAR
jgi:hypothetical protein